MPAHTNKEDKKNGGKDEKSDPPLKIQIVRDNKKTPKEDSIADSDPLAGIDDIDIDKNSRKKRNIPPKKGD
jgi:hypothetical protein